MKISVLIPTYKDPHALLTSVFNLFGMAKHTDKESLEIVAVISEGDPCIYQYVQIEKDLLDLGLDFKLVVSEKSGYGYVNHFYQVGYRQSTGQIILLYNDDVHCTTLEWDEFYRRMLGPIAYGVASATVDETPNPCNYPWAFPAIKREICEALNNRVMLCSPVQGFDRVIPTYAELSGRGVRVPVSYRHEFLMDNDAGGGRKEWLEFTHRPGVWDTLLAAWKSDAVKVEEAIQARIGRK